MQFAALHEELGSAFPFPPRRALAAALIPAAWVDDVLISERKVGLQMFLTDVLHDLHLRARPEVLRFLAPYAPKSMIYTSAMVSTGAPASCTTVRVGEDMAGSYVAASYYPSWSADTLPAHTIDFSKFNVLFFGAHNSKWLYASCHALI